MKQRRIKYERFILPALVISAAVHLMAALIPAGAVDFLLVRDADMERPVRFEVVQIREEPLRVLHTGERRSQPMPKMRVLGAPAVPITRHSLNWTLASATPDLGPLEPPTDNFAPAPAQPANPAVNPDSVARMNSYLSGVLARIERARRYPETARRMGQQGEVEVAFAIGRDGEVPGPAQLVGPSRFGSLNRAACSSVQRSTPFPPLPDCISSDTLGVKVKIVFRLN